MFLSNFRHLTKLHNLLCQTTYYTDKSTERQYIRPFISGPRFVQTVSEGMSALFYLIRYREIPFTLCFKRHL